MIEHLIIGDARRRAIQPVHTLVLVLVLLLGIGAIAVDQVGKHRAQWRVAQDHFGLVFVDGQKPGFRAPRETR